MISSVLPQGLWFDNRSISRLLCRTRAVAAVDRRFWPYDGFHVFQPLMPLRKTFVEKKSHALTNPYTFATNLVRFGIGKGDTPRE